MSVFEQAQKDELVTPGLSMPTDDDFSALEQGLVRERTWFADWPRYITDDDIEKAVKTGDLQELHNSLDLRRIARFEVRAPGFMPYLKPKAWQSAHDFTQLWRDILDEGGGSEVSPRRLAITSMTRSQQYQDRLVAYGQKLASPDSTHCTGMAFDVDASGYYSVFPNGKAYSLTDPRRALGQAAISADLRSRYGEQGHAVERGNIYDSIVTAAAIEAARIMHQQERINLIEEFTGTENACLHIAVSPEYTSD